MILSIIGLCILLYSLARFRKGLILFLIYKIVLVQNITLISIPGIPLLTLDDFMTIAILVIYAFKRKKLRRTKQSFPFRNPFILFAVSWLLSSLFAAAGFGAEITRFIRNITGNLLLIVLIWEQIDKEEDFKRLYRGITILVFISCIYGLIEYMLGRNPIVEYEATLISDAERVINYSYDTVGRGYRIQSFFEHCIGAGMSWAMYFSFVITKVVKGKKQLPYHKLSVLTAALCIPCIILTKMRSPLLFLILCSLLFIDFKRRKFYSLAIVGVFGLIIIFPMITENINILLSFFSRDAQNSISGSNLNMRLEQFQTALQVVKSSPLIGFGEKYRNVLDRFAIRKLYGLESIWLSSLVMYGFIGVITNIIMAYYSIVIIPKVKKCPNARILAVAYWVVASLTSTPGFNMFLYYILYFFFLKEIRTKEDLVFENGKKEM